MSFIFISALRLSETEEMLQAPKFGFIVFCAVLAAGLTIAGYRKSKNWLWLLPAALWLVLAANLIATGFGIYAGKFTTFSDLLPSMISTLVGIAVGLLVFLRGSRASFAPLAAVPGIIAFIGNFILMVTGALP